MNDFTSSGTPAMLQSYTPILILLGVSLLNAVGMVVASHFLSPLRPTPVKEEPYESGMIPLGSTRERFSVKFYMVALLFIVFDIETVFLIPWGVMFRSLGFFGFTEMLVFIGILFVGFIYIWKKGALQWD
ncbi:MAG TPA: NADH-quinone oxidoreductase subunit A [Longimicrobiales bacterium]